MTSYDYSLTLKLHVLITTAVGDICSYFAEIIRLGILFELSAGRGFT